MVMFFDQNSVFWQNLDFDFFVIFGSESLFVTCYGKISEFWENLQ